MWVRGSNSQSPQAWWMVWGADSQEIKKKFNTNDPFGGATPKQPPLTIFGSLWQILESSFSNPLFLNWTILSTIWSKEPPYEQFFLKKMVHFFSFSKTKQKAFFPVLKIWVCLIKSRSTTGTKELIISFNSGGPLRYTTLLAQKA